MPRDIPVGNGEMLVTFDSRYSIRDFYYPHVGQENHAGAQPFHFGIWIDGKLSWVHDDEWTRSIAYEEETLVSQVRLRNEAMQIEMDCTDTVDFHVNVYLRHVTVRNLSPAARLARLYFHQNFSILGNDVGDTAYFDPATRAMIHYKRDRYFLANCCGPESCGINSFATGAKDQPGFEGTFRDAEDGVLSRNPITQGSVDSVIEIELKLAANGEASVHYWIAAANDYDSILKLDQFILSRTPDSFIQRTRDYWRCWVNMEKWNLELLPGPVARLFKRSLLILRTQVDHGGAILAANDSDFLHYSRDTYSYCWPRDGSLVCRALDLAGYGELSQKFFEFCAEVVRPDGYLMHKYNPDGTVASSWLPWINGAGRLPIQEDESALVVWSLWQHYLKYRDLEFLSPLYRPVIIRIADFLVAYRDPNTGLPLPSWDLWEERTGVHAFTCGAVYGGLSAAADCARMFGQEEKAKEYSEAFAQLRQGMDAHLCTPDGKRFLRSLIPVDSQLKPDDSADSSTMGLWAFGAYPPDDPRVLETARHLREKLTMKSTVGGMARYENDPYFRVPCPATRGAGNPWFLCTLWDALHRIRLARSEEQLAAEALPLLLWTAEHALPSGVLAEQIHPETGVPLSVSPLTWSHSTFVECVMSYLARMADLRRCEKCGSSTFAPAA